jgi:Spy/CpxP family protein refolding chaperone
VHAFSIRLLVLVCAILALVSPSIAAHAQQRGAQSFPWGLAEARLMQEKAEVLELSEETLAALEAVIVEVRPEDEKLREGRQAALAKVNALLSESLPDEEAVMRASDALGAIANQSRELKLRCSLKVRSLLTTEQLTKFMEIRAKVRIPTQQRRRRRR